MKNWFRGVWNSIKEFWHVFVNSWPIGLGWGVLMALAGMPWQAVLAMAMAQQVIFSLIMLVAFELEHTMTERRITQSVERARLSVAAA